MSKSGLVTFYFNTNASPDLCLGAAVPVDVAAAGAVRPVAADSVRAAALVLQFEEGYE